MSAHLTHHHNIPRISRYDSGFNSSFNSGFNSGFHSDSNSDFRHLGYDNLLDGRTTLQIQSIIEHSKRVHDLDRCQEFFLSKVKALVPFDFWLSGVAYNTACIVDKVINIDNDSLSLCDSKSQQSWFQLFCLLVEQSTISLAPFASHTGSKTNLRNMQQHTDITIRQYYSSNIFQILVIDPKNKFSTYHCIGMPSPHLKHRYQQVFGEIMPYLQTTFYQSLLNHSKPQKEANPLTSREREVLNLMALGDSNPEIANCLGVSAFTVKNQVHSILTKLNVSNRMQAITKALTQGLIKPHP